MAKKQTTKTMAPDTAAAVPAPVVAAPSPSAASRAFDRGDYHAIRRMAGQGDAEAAARVPLVVVEPAQLAVAVGAIVVTVLLGAAILRY
jgi:hypothetical protein